MQSPGRAAGMVPAWGPSTRTGVAPPIASSPHRRACSGGGRAPPPTAAEKHQTRAALPTVRAPRRRVTPTRLAITTSPRTRTRQQLLSEDHTVAIGTDEEEWDTDHAAAVAGFPHPDPGRRCTDSAGRVATWLHRRSLRIGRGPSAGNSCRRRVGADQGHRNRPARERQTATGAGAHLREATEHGVRS